MRDSSSSEAGSDNIYVEKVTTSYFFIQVSFEVGQNFPAFVRP